MPMAFDDQTAQLPTQYLSWWNRKGWPGRPSNHFTNRIGVTPGTGEIILLRSQLDKIAINEARTLLVYDGDNNQREFPNIHIVRADCITPSIPGHPDAAYRVVVADRRRMWSLIPCDRGYNVRATAGGSYEATTTDSGTPWTWEGMLGDIWDLLNEGSLPALPTTPQGTPDGFAFYGLSCAQALGNVLDRLGWSLAWLPGDDTWQFVELGAADSSFDSLATEMMQYRIDDDEPIDPGIGRYPGNVRVVFTNQPVVTGGKSPYTTIDVVAPAPNQDGEDASLTAIIHDDLPAIYSGATNTNASDLTARANARAAEYFRDLREGGQHYRRIYSGVREFDLGSKVGSVRHETGERGTVTVVERSPVGREWSGTDRMWRMAGGGITSIVGQDGIRVTTSGGTSTLDLTNITPDTAVVGGSCGNPFGASIDTAGAVKCGGPLLVSTGPSGAYTPDTHVNTWIHAGVGMHCENRSSATSYNQAWFRHFEGNWTTVHPIGYPDNGNPPVSMGLFNQAPHPPIWGIPFEPIAGMSGIVAERFGAVDRWGVTAMGATSVDIMGGIVVATGSGGGGGGVTDHGALTGLSDDDHPQYFNQTRGDARYSQLGHTHPLSQLQQSGATGGQYIMWNGSQWVPATITSGTAPVGSILAMAANVMMIGYLPCDGSAVSRVMFSALFGAIGVTWGAGDGVNTFNVPDFRGRAPIGDGQGAGLSNRVLGQTGGAETHTLALNELPSNLFILGGGTATPSGGGTARYSGPGGNAHNNMQPWAAVKYFIKT